MSRYWVFQNNQVVGPHDPEELSQLPGYGPETLVCSEGRKGTNMGDWQRASMMPELSVSLMKASQLATAGGKGAGGALYGSLPPEPTLKDLAALGSLQEKVSFLDTTVTQLQDSLRLKENELLSLHKELEDKTHQAQDLAQKLGTLEERLASMGQLQQTLDKAVAAEQDVESTVQKQARVIEDLSHEIETLKGEQKEIEKLKTDLETLRKAPLQPPPMALAPQAPAISQLFDKPADTPPSPSLSAPPISLEPASPAPLSFAPPPAQTEQPGAGLLFKPEPLAPAPEPAGVGPSASAPGMELGASTGPGLTAAPFGVTAPMPSFNPVPTPAAGQDLAKPRKGKGGTLMLAVVVLGGGVAAAVKLGLVQLPANLPIPGLPLGKQAQAPAAAPSPEPEAPKPPSPEDQAETAKQSAIDMVRRFETPKGPTIGDALEKGLKLNGGLSPWMADKIVEGVFQVNFYSSKPAGGNGQTYEFEVSVADGKVTGHNPVAKALLATRPVVAAAPKLKPGRKAAKAKAAPKDEGGGLLDQGVSAPGYAVGEEPAKKHVARRVAKPSNASLDDLLGDQQGQKKEEGLDQMLMPGMAGKPSEADQQPEAKAAAPKDDSKAAPPPAKDKGAGSDADLLDTMLKP